MRIFWAAPFVAWLLVPASGAEIDRLRTDFAGPASATEILTRRCAELGLAVPPVIRAVREHVPDKPASADTLAQLKASAGEAIRYRRVKLMCGTYVLSEADNWYMPDKLTTGMNEKLDKTDTPFGAVVKPLGFHRQTLDVKPVSGDTVLRVRALLITGAGVPFSLVVENYSRELVALRGQ